MRDRMSEKDYASKSLGIRIEAIAPGYARVTMLVQQHMLNGFGICHGGVITTLADTAFAYACNSQGLAAVASGGAKSMVRVAGYHDRGGIQQALDLGADGILVPYINTAEEAAAAEAKALQAKLEQAEEEAADVGEEGDATLGDLVKDEGERSPFESLRSKSDVKEIDEMLAQLDPREAEVLVLRFGLKGESPLTLEEVGAKFKLTRERVRQIQNIALHKLRRLLEKQDKPVPSLKRK